MLIVVTDGQLLNVTDRPQLDTLAKFEIAVEVYTIVRFLRLHPPPKLWREPRSPVGRTSEVCHNFERDNASRALQSFHHRRHDLRRKCMWLEMHLIRPSPWIAYFMIDDDEGPNAVCDSFEMLETRSDAFRVPGRVLPVLRISVGSLTIQRAMTTWSKSERVFAENFEVGDVIEAFANEREGVQDSVSFVIGTAFDVLLECSKDTEHDLSGEVGEEDHGGNHCRFW